MLDGGGQGAHASGRSVRFGDLPKPSGGTNGMRTRATGLDVLGSPRCPARRATLPGRLLGCRDRRDQLPSVLRHQRAGRDPDGRAPGVRGRPPAGLPPSARPAPSGARSPPWCRAPRAMCSSMTSCASEISEAPGLRLVLVTVLLTSGRDEGAGGSAGEGGEERGAEEPEEKEGVGAPALRCRGHRQCHEREDAPLTPVVRTQDTRYLTETTRISDQVVRERTPSTFPAVGSAASRTR